MKKNSQLEPFRLAKKCPGLDNAEKRALVAIADACTMRDRICRKSVGTITEEHGTSARSFRYGVHGRMRKNGTPYFPGLLERKLVSIKSGGSPKDGTPTVYEINLELLRKLVEGQSESEEAKTPAQTPAQPLHNGIETSAQTGQNLCTVAGVPLHRGSQGTYEVPKVPNTGTREREAVLSQSLEGASPSGSPEARPGSAESTPKAGGQKKPDDVKCITALCIHLTAKAPNPKDVEAMLRDCTRDEIESALRKYVSGLKNSGEKGKADVQWAEKQFFKDGAGFGAVLVIRKERQTAWLAELKAESAKPEFESGYTDIDHFIRKNPPPDGIAEIVTIIETARQNRNRIQQKWDTEHPYCDGCDRYAGIEFRLEEFHSEEKLCHACRQEKHAVTL